ncbi:MAG: methyltransferase family protein [Gemmatimonadaceae bacterium]
MLLSPNSRGGLIGLAAIAFFILTWGLLTKRWTPGSRSARSEKIKQANAHPLMRIPVPWVYVFAYLVGVLLQIPWPIRISSPRNALALLVGGLVLVGAGMIVAFSALGLFRKRGTTTIPFDTPSALVISGPYRFTRNPMYVGLALIYVGVAMTRAEVWPMVVLPLLLAYVSFEVIPVEERRLHEAFGDRYDEYMRGVRRWL